jgi:hypothetical protein
VEQEEEIRALISNFYKDLFASHAGGHLDGLLQHVSSKVTDEMNDSLMKPFTVEEIKQGLDAIGDLKAGADGMASLFYKFF